MGLDHYINAQLYTHSHMAHDDGATTRNQRRVLEKALEHATGSTDLAADKMIELRFQPIRWRKSYLVHDWWCARSDFNESAVSVAREDLIAFRDWLTPMVMAGMPKKMILEAYAEHGTGWASEPPTDDQDIQWIGEELKWSHGEANKLIALVEQPHMKHWWLEYDGSW